MDFVTAVKTCFGKYVDFNGRAQRSEFWWWVLFSLVVNLVLGWIPIIGWLVALGLFLPGLAVTVRRLHDTNRTGWFALIGIAGAALGSGVAWILGQGTIGLILGAVIYLAAIVYLIIMLIEVGTRGDNDYGPDPLQGAG